MPRSLATSAIKNYSCILIVGPSGTGKTTFMTRLKLPGQRTYILDVDGNLAGPGLVATKEKRDISHIDFDMIRFEDDGQTPVPPLQQYQRLAAKLAWAKQQKLPDGRQLYGLIGLTSITTLNDVLAHEVRRQMNKPVDYIFQLQDWGKYSYLWNFFVMEVLRGLPCHIILDGHQKIEKDQMDQVLRYVLNIPGSTSDTLTAKMTDVWLASVEQQITPTGQLAAQYKLTTVQSARIPGMKTSLDLPAAFINDQAGADRVSNQLALV